MDHEHAQHSALAEAQSFFSTAGFMPHGHCYLWKPELVWTHFLSDMLIGFAYVGISILLYGLVKKIKLPFSGMFLAFGAFIAFCGGTHFMEVWTLWKPDYWLSGGVKVVTALASVATYILLFPIRPKILEMAAAARLSEERRTRLETAHQELGVLYERVRESDEVKTQFFANVSHELRTPLALILGPTDQLLADLRLAPDQKQKVEMIERNSKMLLKLVNDLLDISKLEAGRLRPQYAEIDLVQLLKVTAAYFETAMQSKGIFFSLQAPSTLSAQLDSEKFQRVLMNLLSNAVKFVPEGGRVRVALEEGANGNASIRVEDTGPGIRPELRPHIFERFRQGEGGVNRQFGGTGLGLAIAKDFVEMHGGTIRLIEGNTSGATFVIDIPLRAPKGTLVQERAELLEKGDVMVRGTVDALMPDDEQHLVTRQESAGRPVVLVCEDNPDMRRHIAEALVDSFDVTTAVDGREGLDKAMALKPDLIVSDIMMPNMGGDALVREIKAREELSGTPILLLSARADDDLRIGLLKAGASDYLFKPFSREELRARAGNLARMNQVRQILERELATQSSDLVALAREIAAQKREAQLAKDMAEIARAHAEKASQVKGNFLSLVSHELNTPLTSIHLTLQILMGKEASNFNPRQLKMVERMMIASRNLRDLVDSLLEYTRVESGRIITHIQRFDLAEMVAKSVEEQRPLAQQKGLELKQHAESASLAIESDPKLIGVILANLIGNAVKYTERGSIEVSFSQSADSYLLRVKDTGVGIPKEDQARIFDPFVQLEPLAQKSTGGVGLGLALVNQIVKSLGGEIRLESEIDAGSTFTVSLPRKLTPPV